VGNILAKPSMGLSLSGGKIRSSASWLIASQITICVSSPKSTAQNNLGDTMKNNPDKTIKGKPSRQRKEQREAKRAA
jgi:hypothetical protein